MRHLEHKVSLGVVLQRECVRVMIIDNSAAGSHKVSVSTDLVQGACKFYR